MFTKVPELFESIDTVQYPKMNEAAKSALKDKINPVFPVVLMDNCK